MELIKQYMDLVPKDVDVEGFCQGVTSYIMQAYKYNNVDIKLLENSSIERLTASVGIYSKQKRQVWLIGDCQAIVNKEYYDNPKPQEAILSQKRSQVLKELILKGYPKEQVLEKDPGREAILSGIIKGCQYQNILYSVVDGFPIPVDKVKVIDVPKGSKEVILSTDGYPFLRDTLKESERLLKELLEEDPLLIDKYKATKAYMNGYNSFDDRTYVRFLV